MIRSVIKSLTRPPCIRRQPGQAMRGTPIQALLLLIHLSLCLGFSVGCNVLPPLAWTQEQACLAANDEDCDGVRACDDQAPLPGCDCDDRHNDVFPRAAELCDGKDNDCSGRPDDDPRQDPQYPDRDGDGYGDRSIEIRCDGVVPGYIRNGGDCLDNPDAELDGFTTAFDIHPFASERCNELDDNCNGIVNEEDQLRYSQWYPDRDGDGFGAKDSAGRRDCMPAITDGKLERENNYDCNDGTAKIGPSQKEVCDDAIDNNCDGIDVDCANLDPDEDGSHYAEDCNEQNSSINPKASEVCNGIDDNCNGQIDEDLSNEGRQMYPDVDGDSFGDSGESGDGPEDEDNAVTLFGCNIDGYVTNNDDCDDLNAAIRPGAVDVCNEIDDDCDLVIDEDPDRLFYRDEDGDLFGDPAVTQLDCTPPEGYIANSSDCDDTDPRINPNATVCLGLDSNCNEVPNTEDPLMTDKTCGLSFDRYIAPQDSEEPIPCECMPHYTSIQAAIDAALEGDVLGIEAGEYLEMLSLRGKAITLRGLKGPALTILNAEQRGTAVLINSGEGLETYLEDMTITGGAAPATAPVSELSFGGGIRIENASPQLSGLWIVNNQASAGGGGIAVIGSKPILQQLVIQGNHAKEGAGIYIDLKSNVQLNHAVISDNTASVNGGAISLLDSFLTLESAFVVNNAAATCGTDQGYGGGVHVNFYGYLLGRQLHVMDNSACTGGGIALLDGRLTLDGGILAKNSASDDPNLYAALTSVSVELTNSLLWNSAVEDLSEAAVLASGSSIASSCLMDDSNCLYSSARSKLDFWILEPTCLANSPYIMTANSPNIPGAGVIPGAYGGSGKTDWDLNRDGRFAWYEPTDQWPPDPNSDDIDTEDIPLSYVLELN